MYLYISQSIAVDAKMLTLDLISYNFEVVIDSHKLLHQEGVQGVGAAHQVPGSTEENCWWI